MKVAVVYWSGTGNTEVMAQSVAKGAEAVGAEVQLFPNAEFTSEQVSAYDAFAFGCSACGAEELDEAEFVPMWESVSPELGEKKVALFGSYGWGGGEWMETWKEASAGLNIVATCVCEAAPEGDALSECEELGKALA